MKKPETHKIELQFDEYAALIDNPMIMCACDDLLASPRRSGGFVLLRLTEEQLQELTGWVAAEANHAKTRDEAEALGGVCEYLESNLATIRMRGKI